MGISIETLVAAKKFTSETVLGGGAVVGKNVTISSIAPIDGGNRITFSYTLDNGTAKTSTLDVMNGVDGKQGAPGVAGNTPVKGVDYFDGEKGDDGFSPVITIAEISGGHKVTITTANGEESFDIMDGKDGSGSSTGEENVIESIKVNGVAQIVAEDKSVDITVPTVDVDKNYVDTELAKKANTSDIPSLDGYVTDEELNAKGYLTEVPSEYITEEELTAKGYLTSHQDISGKVDKVKGKSLIADTEIERLKSVKNYDDTEIKTELAKKANSTDIPTKVSGLQNDSNYQTDTDVTTTLTPYATKTYVGEQISNADHLKREIVTEIPKPETADKNTIYMLKIESVTGNDKYREYLLIDGTVQCIGDTSVDLTDYAKTTDVDKKLNNKADKTEIPTVPTNVSEFTNDAGYLTEHQDISNLVVKEEGKGLSSNDYTSEEKTKLGGVGTSQGRNLIPYPLTNRTTNGIAYTVQSDGSVLANGTASAENNAYYNFAYKTLKLGDTSYTLSCEGLPKSVYVYVYDETIGKAVANVSDTPVTKTFVGDSTHTYSLSINVGKGTPVSDLAIKPILEMGTIAHAYEPISESNVNLKDAIDKVSTSQGRNLISYPYYNGTSYESNGVTYTVNEVDGTITVNGKSTKESDFRLISPYDTSDRKILELGQTYTLSDGVNQPNASGYQAPVYFQFVRIDTTKNDFNYGISTNYGNMTWTASDTNLLQYGIRVVVREGATVDNVVLKPMLEIGSIAHMYEPTTESNVSLKKSIETKATINDTSTTSTTETWSAKKINEKTAYNFDKRIILSVSRSSGTYTDTARLNSNTGVYLYWSSVAGQEKYSVGVILYVYNDWLVIPIKETDGGTYINFSVKDSVLTMEKNNTTFPCAGGVIALGTDI